MARNPELRAGLTGERIRNRQKADAILLEMFSLDELPEQRITEKEQEEFSKRIARGDQDAKQEYILRRLRFAMIVAMSVEESQPESSSLTLEDIFQNVIEALQKRLDEYSLHDSQGLAEYIGWINRIAERENKNTSTIVKIPIHVYEKLGKISKFTANYKRETGEEPSDEDIALALGLKQDEIEQARRGEWWLSHDILPLELDKEIEDLDVDVFDLANNIITKEQLRIAADKLYYHKQRILQLYFGLEGEAPMELKDIGAMFGVSVQVVWWRKEKALEELRELPEIQALSAR